MALTETPPYLVGNVVGVSVGGTLLYAKSGNVTRRIGQSNVTNSRSNGYRELRGVTKSLDVTAECVYNGDDPPTIEEGDEVEVIWSATDGHTYTSDCLVTELRDAFNVENDYTWSFNGLSSGSYTNTPPA
jgi:hypothetical protein